MKQMTTLIRFKQEFSSYVENLLGLNLTMFNLINVSLETKDGKKVWLGKSFPDDGFIYLATECFDLVQLIKERSNNFPESFSVTNPFLHNLLQDKALNPEDYEFRSFGSLESQQ